MNDRETLLALIDIQKRKIADCEDKIGRLMSKRVTIQERLAQLYAALEKVS